MWTSSLSIFSVRIDVTALVLEIFLETRRSRSSMFKKSVFPPKLRLAGVPQAHAALVHEARKGPVDNRCADLALDVSPMIGTPCSRKRPCQ